MSQLQPTVRYLIVCEDVQTDPDRPRRISLVGLIGTILTHETPGFPLFYDELCVFVQLTECRGPAEGRVEIRYADTDEIAMETETRSMPLPNEPLAVIGVVFRLQNLRFNEPGLYWVQFWYNDVLIAQQPLLARSGS